MSSFLTRRAGFWHFARRVPQSLTALDRSGVVRQSTKIRIADDPKGTRAKQVAESFNRELEAYWRGLAAGQATESKNRYDAARKRARDFGFDYAPAIEIALRPTLERLQRLEALTQSKGVENEHAAAALLGGENPPIVMLSDLFETFEDILKGSMKDFSPDQLRKWRNPKLRAVANLINVIRDKPITQVSRGDALDFRNWWQERVVAEQIEIATANKDIGHINRMFRTVERSKRLGLEPIFGDLRIEGERTRSRAAFTAAFVQDVVLKPEALAGLNVEATRVVHLIAETGLRLSEAVNLTSETIALDAAVPHVKVRPDGRRMKTAQSERDVPLVGVALLAMQAQPNGFPRYRDKAASLSATVNKALGAANLRPTENHSIYSLRHTFEDRLTAIEAPEKLIAALMGHKYSRPKYGAGPSLEQKLEWLQRIAFKLPSTV